jgi:hypothetical protein
MTISHARLRRCHGVIGLTLSQRPSEAKFVTIRVGEVEEPLAPFGIVRCRVWAVAGRDHARMEGVNVGMVEDNTSPPRPISLGRLGNEIEIAVSNPKTRKRCLVTTMNDLKAEHAIEANSARHNADAERKTKGRPDGRPCFHTLSLSEQTCSFPVPGSRSKYGACCPMIKAGSGLSGPSRAHMALVNCGCIGPKRVARGLR